MNSSALSTFQFQKSSAYEHFDYALAKFEQSFTTDLPMQAAPANVQMHTRKHAAKNAAGRIAVQPAPTPFDHNPPVHLKRTAIAMASLKPIPAIQPAPTSRRRQLLPAPKTAFLPAGDPQELRAIIRQTQDSHCLRIENARATARLNTLNLAQARAQKAAREAAARNVFTRLTASVVRLLDAPVKFAASRLGDLIDSLALA